MTTLSPMDRLAKLAAQRTARTDRLHETINALLDQLEEHLKVGDCATVDGWTLSLDAGCTNVGHYTLWAFSRGSYEDSEVCYPEKGVDSEGYVHGDFNHEVHGPSRAQLIELAKLAPRFVAAFAAKLERENAELESGATAVSAALEQAKAL